MSSMIPRGNANKLVLVDVVASPAQVAATTTAERAFTVPGVLAGSDFVLSVTKPTAQAGLALGGARVSADGEVSVVFVNATEAAITPTASQILSPEEDSMLDKSWSTTVPANFDPVKAPTYRGVEFVPQPVDVEQIAEEVVKRKPGRPKKAE